MDDDRFPIRMGKRLLRLLILASILACSAGCETFYNAAQEKAKRECLNRADSTEVSQCLRKTESFEDYKANREKLQKGEANSANR